MLFRSRFWPLRLASNLLIKLTNVIVKGEGLKQGPFIGESEFLGIVEAAAQESVIEHEERELIESVIEFGDTIVREIMVPRPDVVFVDDDLTVTTALNKAVHEGFSRLPVFRKDDDEVDDVVGIELGERRGNVAGTHHIEHVLAHRLVEIREDLGIEAGLDRLDNDPALLGVEPRKKVGEIGRAHV